jgi:hypothetical protein
VDSVRVPESDLPMTFISDPSSAASPDAMHTTETMPLNRPPNRRRRDTASLLELRWRTPEGRRWAGSGLAASVHEVALTRHHVGLDAVVDAEVLVNVTG